MADNSGTFDCPVCLDVPADKIYQCKNGHIICRKCSESVTLCPQCRVEYGEDKIRNIVLEDILDKRILDCPNKMQGCTQTFFRNTIGAHTMCCKFRDFEICEKLGFNCKFAVQKTNSSAIVEHFQKEHNSALNAKNMGTLILESFKDTQENKTRIWTPLFFQLTEDNTEKFFITFAKINAGDQTLSVGTIIVRSKEEHASKYWTKYSVATSECIADVEPLEWISPVNNLDSLDYFVGITSLRLPLHLLRAKYLNKDDCLEVSVKIQSGLDSLDCKPKNEAIEVFYALPNYSSDLEPSKQEVVKIDTEQNFMIKFLCYACKSQIKGIRHHCIQCRFYELCDKCAQSGIHSHHLFTKITNCSQACVIYRLKFNSILKDFLPLVSQDETVESTKALKCTECKKSGPNNGIAVCIECSTLYGICSNCWEKHKLRNTCDQHKLFVVEP